MKIKSILLVVFFFITTHIDAQVTTTYHLRVANAAAHQLTVSMDYILDTPKDTVDFYIPRWTPGYYQIIDFGNRLSAMSALNKDNDPLQIFRESSSHWKIATKGSTNIKLNYTVLADSDFVAQSFLDTDHAYIIPTSCFLYSDRIQARDKIKLFVEKYPSWPSVFATGLDCISTNEKYWEFETSSLDDFYDSPILLGKLDSLHSFTIQNIPHSFVGYKLNENVYCDSLMHDLQRIIQYSTNLFEDVPYNKYVFLGIGDSHGGIEHLNSASVSFNGASMHDHTSYIRTLSFLTHEYFHNFNVKRIRPIELGPFDYQNENRTRQLWISEGLTVYYENWLLWKVGILSKQEFLNTFSAAMNIYENKKGHLIQSLASSSWNTWSDGPFGNLSDTAISYYDKGPVVGLLFDCAIQHYSKGKYTLENVMKDLYNVYYKKEKRGFTEDEFRSIAIKYGTDKISPLFDYIYTAKEVDYNKYLLWNNIQLDISDSYPRRFHLR